MTPYGGMTETRAIPPDTVSMVCRNFSTSSNDARRMAPELMIAPAPPWMKYHRPVTISCTTVRA